MKTKRIGACLTAFFFIMSCFAAVSYAQQANGFNGGQITDAKKAWTIEFNVEIDEDSIDSDSLFITDDEGVKIAVERKVSRDKKSVSISPAREYEAGKRYQLHITDLIRSKSGFALVNPTTIPFSLKANTEAINSTDDRQTEKDSAKREDDTQSARDTKQKEQRKENDPSSSSILSVDFAINEFVTTITVKTNGTFAYVFANGVNMHYKGNQTFSLAIPGIGKGEQVLIEAYDANNQKQFSQKYTVND